MDTTLLLVFIFFIALMYSVVGHGGASGFIAALALFSVPAGDIRFYALILNLFVSGIAFYSFYNAGHFKFGLLWPFAIASIPFAYLGGTIAIHQRLLHIFIAVALLIAAVQLLVRYRAKTNVLKKVPLNRALPIGAGIGFVAGLLGIGGGILLSPIIIFFKWADAKTTAAVSASFIFLNSLSGLAGQLSIGTHVSQNIIYYALVALLGGFIGSGLGSNRFSVYHLKVALSVVLIIASIKLLNPI